MDLGMRTRRSDSFGPQTLPSARDWAIFRSMTPCLRSVVLIVLLGLAGIAQASRLLIPMDEGQSNHLKAYGVAFWVLEQGLEVEWLLNYRGGSFLIPSAPAISSECVASAH